MELVFFFSSSLVVLTRLSGPRLCTNTYAPVFRSVVINQSAILK
jgi:hypothetical protein